MADLRTATTRFDALEHYTQLKNYRKRKDAPGAAKCAAFRIAVRNLSKRRASSADIKVHFVGFVKTHGIERDELLFPRGRQTKVEALS
jgi:hypothetical protein